VIKAIISDFGRVITAQKPASLFHRYEDQLGIARDRLIPIMFDCEAWPKMLAGQITREEYWQAIGPQMGLSRPQDRRAFYRQYMADERVNREVVRILRRLRGKYKVAVLSNAPPGLDQWLRRWRIRDLFDVVFCSAEEGLVKPDPAAYRAVLERLGVEPNEAVFVDDLPENVAAAQALGLQGIVFDNATQLSTELHRLGVLEREESTHSGSGGSECGG
jgi:epoxide hydrolase-like predicted phosphatase